MTHCESPCSERVKNTHNNSDISRYHENQYGDACHNERARLSEYNPVRKDGRFLTEIHDLFLIQFLLNTRQYKIYMQNIDHIQIQSIHVYKGQYFLVTHVIS